jgi:TRAP-type mannitol/chloroaromatic compound transport system permease small subunit
MNVQSFLHTVDGISTWAGKAVAWLIMILMAVVCVEVFKRYIMNSPDAWIFDIDNMLYGTLFMLCGAYTLAQNAHVRGDFLYSSMRPRVQASLDIVLYVVFFIPGIAEIVRCAVCLQTGRWPSRLHDVAETDVIEEQLANSQYVDEDSRKIAIERAKEIDEVARQRGMGGDLNT